MSEETFKRGQAEYALWQFMTGGRIEGDEPHQIFRSRIKRLLDIDRASGPGCAFFEAAPTGSGTDARFAGFDVFCLALALDLLDIGFKQGEVVTRMRGMRPLLRQHYEWVQVEREKLLAKGRKSDPPKYSLSARDAYRVFLVLRKVEVTEAWPAEFLADTEGRPVTFEPKVIHGISGLKDEFDGLGLIDRKAMVLEITVAAERIQEYLRRAPLRTRGPN